MQKYRRYFRIIWPSNLLAGDQKSGATITGTCGIAFEAYGPCSSILCLPNEVYWLQWRLLRGFPRGKSNQNLSVWVAHCLYHGWDVDSQGNKKKMVVTHYYYIFYLTRWLEGQHSDFILPLES